MEYEKVLVCRHISGNKRTTRFGVVLYNFLSTMLLAELVICIFQVLCDHIRRTAFNMVALQHVHQLTILEQRHAWR